MEKDEIELIDYFRVIWKRKILIIVGTLACIVAGVVVNLRLPVTFSAEAFVRIGKTVDLNDKSSSFALIDTLENLAKTIPVEYRLKDEEALEYDLNVEMARGTSLIKIVLEGPDERKTKEFFNEVVEKLTADHFRKTESSIQIYKVLIEKQEAYIKEIQNELEQKALELKKAEKGVDIEVAKEINQQMKVEAGVDEVDPFTSMMIQNNQRESRNTIRSLQDKIFQYRLIINTLEESKTRLIGEVAEIDVKSKKIRNIVLSGLVGLMMSLFLAFFIEYLARVRESVKDSVPKIRSTDR